MPKKGKKKGKKDAIRMKYQDQHHAAGQSVLARAKRALAGKNR